MSNNSFMAKSSIVEHNWFVVDAENMILGRLATKVAHILKGKHKSIYTQHVDTGDFVVIVNAEKIKVTGKKMSDKNYYRHTGFPGGIKSVTLQDLIEKKPTQAIELAVKGMLPRTKLGRQMLKKLKVYSGGSHPHAAQNPAKLEL
ncbi:MAG: 50S ribosomal protein L13 [Legionellales bacterium]|nr:50S ribosomal protein L13 [Legionellales bacterium]